MWHYNTMFFKKGIEMVGCIKVYSYLSDHSLNQGEEARKYFGFVLEKLTFENNLGILTSSVQTAR